MSTRFFYGMPPDVAMSQLNALDDAATTAIATSQDWATKTDAMVGGVDYSAKYYSQQAAGYASQAQLQVQVDWAITDVADKRYVKNKPAIYPPANQSQSYADYLVNTATYVRLTLPGGVTTFAAGKAYRVVLVTESTSTSTGAVYIVTQTGATTWTAGIVATSGNTSNNPLMRISADGTGLEIYHNHANSYNIRALIQTWDTGNTTNASPMMFGLEGVLTAPSGVPQFGANPLLHYGNIVGFLNGSTGNLLGDLYQANATFLKSKKTDGTGTRIFGLNASNYLYIGGIDTALTGIVFENNSAEFARFDSTGNLLLGAVTTENGSKLTITGSASGGNSLAVVKNTSTAGSSAWVAKDDTGTKYCEVGVLNSATTLGADYGLAGEGYVRASSSASGLNLSASNVAGYIRFSAGNGGASTEAMRVITGGKVLIGATADDGSGSKLQVAGNIRLNGACFLGGAAGTYTGHSSAITLNYSGGGSQYGIVFKPATSIADTKVLDFLKSTSTQAVPVALASIDHLSGDAGMNLNGTWKLNNNTILTSAQSGAANGVAPLDATAKIPSAYLPAYVDDVLEYANAAAFPATGASGVIYLDLSTTPATQYRWSGTAYVSWANSPGTTDALVEGTTNKYFTAARVLSTVLAGYAAGAATVLAATDTLLGALGKLQGQISTKVANTLIDAANGIVGLTGYAINFKNAAGTFVSSLTNAATAARTYTFPDKSGTVAMLSDITASTPYKTKIADIDILVGAVALDLTTAFSSTYDDYTIEIVLKSSVSGNAYFQFANGGVIDSNPNVTVTIVNSSGPGGSTSSTVYFINGATTHSEATFELRNANASGTGQSKNIWGFSTTGASGPAVIFGSYTGGAVSGIKFFFPTAATGSKIRIFGITK